MRFSDSRVLREAARGSRCNTALRVCGNRRVSRILAVFGGEFPGCKGAHRFFVRQDAIQAVPVAGVMLGVSLLDKLLLGPVFAVVHGRPAVNGNISRLGHLQDMGVQLVGQDAHDAIGEFPETHQPEKLDHFCGKEEAQDVASEDDAIKAAVLELDIRSELLHKGICHGQYPFSRTFFAEHPIEDCP